MGEDEYDPPIILGRPFLSTVKAIIDIGTKEVHMHFPSEKVRRYFTNPNYIFEESNQVRKRRNRNQRREIIKDGWADYEGVDTVFGHVPRIGRVWIGKEKATVTGLRGSCR